MEVRHADIRRKRVRQPRRRLTHEEIAAVAYSLYEHAGRPEGKSLEHWFNAEAMLEENLGQGNNHQESNFLRELH